MREILFRAKKLKDRKWVYGHYYHRSEVTKDGLINQHFIVEWTKHHETIHHQIDPETLGQYTGLKDGNNKRIFGGDIYDNHISKHIIVFADGAFFAREIGISDKEFKERNIEGYPECKDYLNQEEASLLDIIGNIHDNPELLEVKQ